MHFGKNKFNARDLNHSFNSGSIIICRLIKEFQVKSETTVKSVLRTRLYERLVQRNNSPSHPSPLTAEIKQH